MNPPEVYAQLSEQCVAAANNAINDEQCKNLLQEGQIWATLALASATNVR